MLAFIPMTWYSWTALGLLVVILIAVKLYRNRQM